MNTKLLTLLMGALLATAGCDQKHGDPMPPPVPEPEPEPEPVVIQLSPHFVTGMWIERLTVNASEDVPALQPGKPIQRGFLLIDQGDTVVKKDCRGIGSAVTLDKTETGFGETDDPVYAVASPGSIRNTTPAAGETITENAFRFATSPVFNQGVASLTFSLGDIKPVTVSSGICINAGWGISYTQDNSTPPQNTGYSFYPKLSIGIPHGTDLVELELSLPAVNEVTTHPAATDADDIPRVVLRSDLFEQHYGKKTFLGLANGGATYLQITRYDASGVSGNFDVQLDGAGGDSVQGSFAVDFYP